ncbi:MAG: energy transducer TonB [Gammaproteobacteria bacterium]
MADYRQYLTGAYQAPMKQTAIGWSGDASRDHLSSTLFIAALIHGVLIMGVTFTAGDDLFRQENATSLEVVLLTGDYEDLAEPEHASYLADKNLAGAGTTQEDVQVKVAYGQQPQQVMPGQEQDGSMDYRKRGQRKPTEQLMISSNSSEDLIAILEKQAESDPEIRLRTGMSGESNPVEIMADPDEVTQLRSPRPRELIISANTRESRIAGYLDGWKRKVERVGTMNFPQAAQAGVAKNNPTLEVAIASDGDLIEVRLLSTSGNRGLDQAAMDILRMSAPFEAFPDFLQQDYDSLRFAYEWQFSGNISGIRAKP